MKNSISTLTLVIVLGCLCGWLAPQVVLGNKERAFSKRKDLALLTAPSPDAKKECTAEWNEELEVLEQQGRWYKVSSSSGKGWVYQGNLSWEKLPEENKNDLPFTSSGVSAAAAARGLTDEATKYAEHKDYGEQAEALTWAIGVNKQISKSDARTYLKSAKLGEYQEAK
jgi:hypothetical protein